MNTASSWPPPWPTLGGDFICPDSPVRRPMDRQQVARTSSSTESWSMWNEPSPLTELSPSPSLPLDPVKREPFSRPSSPHFIIEPLLPVVHKPSSHHLDSHRSSESPITQSELAERLLLSQSLAPPTQVPLRATHATSEMLEMMGSFRLNPFAFHTKNKGVERDDTYLTWCGEEPKPLDEEPIIIEWQLEGCSDGTLEGIDLIVMDDQSCSASDDGAPPFHDSSQQLPFPFPMTSQLSSNCSSDTHCTAVSLPVASPGPATEETPDRRPIEPPERSINDEKFGAVSDDSANARFRLPTATSNLVQGAPSSHSENDLRFDSPESSSSSSSHGSCYRRASSTEYPPRLHNSGISRPYPNPAERGRVQLHPRNNEVCQPSEPFRYRGPIDPMLNGGANISHSVTMPSPCHLPRSHRMKSRTEASSPSQQHPVFTLSKVTSWYQDDQYQYQNQQVNADNHTPATSPSASIGLPSLPTCLVNGTGNSPQRSPPQTRWSARSRTTQLSKEANHTRPRWFPEEQAVAPLEHPQPLSSRGFRSGPMPFSPTSSGTSSPPSVHSVSNSWSSIYSGADLSIPRGLSIAKAIDPPFHPPPTSPITTIPTNVELYAASTGASTNYATEPISERYHSSNAEYIPGTSSRPRPSSGICSVPSASNGLPLHGIVTPDRVEPISRPSYNEGGYGLHQQQFPPLRQQTGFYV
ncbi:hypothetical protein PM082_008668 [Marasmius tenuissimus]|nr:hypothetical protein PM082_008668 [Marasmius tenuissimus]